MMMLQPQVTLLDRFVIQQESIPNFMPPLGSRQPQMQFTRGADGINNLVKNVCILSIIGMISFQIFQIIYSFLTLFLADSKYVDFEDFY